MGEGRDGNISGTGEESDSGGGSSNATAEGSVKVVKTGKGSNGADGRDSGTGERSHDGSNCVAGYSGVGDNAAVRQEDDSEDVILLNPDTEHPFLSGFGTTWSPDMGRAAQ